MTRSLLAIISGLLLVLAVVPQVPGQAPAPRRPTLSERITAFGRGLTQGTEETPPPPVKPEAATGRTTFPQVDSRSLLPNNMVERRPGQTTTPAPSQHQPANARAIPPANAAPAPAGTGEYRTASRPRVGSARDTETYQGGSLPGLGGSPLPPSAAQDEATSENIGDDSSAAAGNGPAPMRSGSGPTIQSPSGSSASGVRNSPLRRAPMHVDPNELRRKLTGSYPDAATVAPTAKATNEAPGDASASPAIPSPAGSPTIISAAKGRGNNELTPSADAIITVPTVEASELQPKAPTASRNSPAIRRDTSAPNASNATSGRGGESTVEPFQTKSTTTASTATTPAQSTATAGPRFTDRKTPAGASQVGGNDANVLVTNQTPIIASDIRGPKQILVGREAVYRIRLNNQGTAPADSIEVAIRVPSWADIVETNPTSGTAGQSPSDAKGLLKWQLGRLEPNASETIDVRLIPRSSRPLELGVSWTLAPVGSRTIVEVQEPKLELHVAGPDEVLYGKPQVYRFTLTNPGTGVAENVKIDLFPPGGGEKAAASNQLGNLAPGKSQTIEVELIARDAGKLNVKAVASAAGELASEAVKEVFCRKPQLSIDSRGPEMKYAGTDATYYVRVRNPGTSPAEDVTVRATLPEGAKFISASEGQSYDATRREVAWRVGSLGPGDDNYMELKCTVNTPGKNQLRLEAATAAGDLSDKKSAETNVVALADLKLDVSDPSGPVAVGDEAVYEIRVQNRGASAATDINVVALFSAGVEPDKVDGAQYSVSDGRVSFRAIDELPAGRQIVFHIGRPRAVQPGTHVFRAEVLCRNLDIKLAAEETTRFYANESGPAGEADAPGNSNSNHGFESASTR